MARSLVMLAALVLWASVCLLFVDNGVHVGPSTVVCGTQVVEHARLPILAESAAPDLGDSGARESDNATVPVSSSGAVKASFTVFSRPVSSQGVDGAATTGDTAYDLKSISGTAPAQTETRANSGGQPMQNDSSIAVLDAHSEPGALSMGWALLVAAWSVGIALVCGLAFIRISARG